MTTPDEVKAMIENIGTTLEPDGDWIPCLHIFKDGSAAIVGLFLMENDQQKDICAKVMYQIIKRTNPDQVTFISTAWQGAPFEKDQFEDERAVIEAYQHGWIPRPSMDPDRVEIVMAIMVNKEHHTVMMMGELARSPDKPPKIVQWRQWDDNDPGSGRFGEAIANGFRDADPNGNLEVLSELQQNEE